MENSQTQEKVIMSEERLKVLARISECEKARTFDVDVEDDPEPKELLPNEIDYLNKKLSSKLKCRIANFFGTKFFEKLIKQGALRIKEVRGIENFKAVKTGAIITCNHFNVADNYIVWHSIKPHMKKGLKQKYLYKVIKEGNYTNSPPPFRLILRHCNTLPLSSNKETMRKFMRSVDTLLKRGEKILVYPEQCMWWNYRKPRPLKNGAFRFAVNSMKPVIPMFVTMEDSSDIGPDGFPIQEHTLHIFPAIYPNAKLSKPENIKSMMDENYKLWVKTYEEFYKKPLVFEE